jgi:hypothetical protein
VEGREDGDVAPECPRPAKDDLEHRAARYVFEHQRVVPDLEHLRNRKAVLSGMPHDHRLAFGVAAGLEATEYASVPQVEDLRSPAGGDQRAVSCPVNRH